MAAIILGNFRFVPAFWVGVVIVLLAHELGHASAVALYRLRILSLEMHGLGGRCRWDGHVSPVGRSVIAWSGIVAQVVLLALTMAGLRWLGPPPSGVAIQLTHAFVRANIVIGALNLVPLGALDGAEAWRLFPRLWRRVHARDSAVLRRDLGLNSLARTLERPRHSAPELLAARELDLMTTIERTQPEFSREADALIGRVVKRAVVELRQARRRE